MSEYFDNKDLFLEPKTTQYGSHMVMTNVTKSTKRKYINIDTRFRDDYSHGQLANYIITLPQRINEAKTMTITNMEIPNSIFNISSSLGNNSFTVTNNSNLVAHTITLPDSQYGDLASIQSVINTQLHAFDVSFSVSINSANKLSFSLASPSAASNYKLQFAVDSSGNFDKYLIRSKLGWLLGFRNSKYTLTTNVVAEALSDLNGSRYLYLAIDEFAKGNQYSFISPLHSSLINKNIIARISMDNINYPFGKIIVASCNGSGNLVSDTRSYTGKIDLQKLNIQLLNEYGNPVNLNGLDFSFCIRLDHE